MFRNDQTPFCVFQNSVYCTCIQYGVFDMTCQLIATSGVFPRIELPLFLDRVPAGFPSPCLDYVERPLDLNELCIRRPAATFFCRAQGDSMVEVGIYDHDVLVVDRSITAKHGDVVIASFMGEFTCKVLETDPTVRLVPANPKYQPIEIPEGAE